MGSPTTNRFICPGAIEFGASVPDSIQMHTASLLAQRTPVVSAHLLGTAAAASSSSSSSSSSPSSASATETARHSSGGTSAALDIPANPFASGPSNPSSNSSSAPSWEGTSPTGVLSGA